MKKALLCFVLFLMNSLCTRAQVANNTALVGTTLDSAGHAVAGAKIVAVEERTKVVSQTVTNEQGYYAIAYILPGIYDVTVEQPGFSKGVTTGIIVTNDVSVRTDFSLKAGGVTDVVTVSAANAPLDTDDARLGETFDKQQIEDLPVQGHNALEFAALESNVIIGSKTSYSGNPPGLDFIGAGQRETQNELTLDGVSIMNNLGNLAPARPSSDMVSEVQMQSGNYTAQYGAYLGLHVNVVSKNGTNNFHGNVYDYVKNSALNAHNFFDAPGAKKAPLNYNQYGFTLGGPVLIPKLYDGRNKTFFFGAYEKLN